MRERQKKRNINIDVIRCVAVFSVISVHFFRNNGFYGEPVVGKRMYCMVLMRTAFMVCVPLFLLITGYLMGNKSLNKGYYKGIKRTLEIYCLSAIVYMIFEKFILKNDISLKRGIVSIFGNYIGYSWYVEMYIGLFLLIPFLNVLYHGLESQKKKEILIATLFVCCTLPNALNIFDWFNLDFWIRPNAFNDYILLLPDWWIDLYPLMYYFIGMYIKEYDFKISLYKNFILWVVVLIGFGTFNFYRSFGGVFESAEYNSWGGFENVISTVLLFLFMLHIDFSKVHTKVRWVIVKISELAFGAYLLSVIVDSVVYPRLNSYVAVMPKRLEWYWAVIPIVFCLSLVLSQIVNWLCDIAEKGITKVLGKRILRNNI